MKDGARSGCQLVWRFASDGNLAEQVFLGGADDLGGGGIFCRAIAVASDDYDRDGGGFWHGEAGAGGEFVGRGQDGGVEGLVVLITSAAEVEDRGDPGGADSN